MDIYRNGKIHTGFYSNWCHLSKEDKKLVLAEQDRLGMKGKSDGNSKKSEKKWKKQVKGLMKDVAALKMKAPNGDLSDESSVEPTHDAGNAFGGRSEKAKKKKHNN